MRKRVGRLFVAGTFVIGWLATAAAMAEGANVWDGPYLGPQLGSATSGGCSLWAASGAELDMSGQTLTRACGTGGLVGGLRVGDNFQYGHFFWGVAADLDITTAKKSNQQSISNGTPAPAGTYFASDRLSPPEFLVLAPRVGYAGGEWAPYLTAGALVPFGGRDSALSYTPTGATQATLSFRGGKGFNAIGPVAGGGIEWGLNGPWSVGLEYMHASLGKSSNAIAPCAGTAAACEGLAGTSFQNLHTAPTFNMFRIAANYYFDYW